MTSITEIWKRYKKGKASKEDKERLVRAIDDKNVHLDEALSRSWHEAGEIFTDEEEVSRAKEKLRAELGLDKKGTTHYYRFGVAAGIAALLAVSLFLYIKINDGNRITVSVASGEQIKEVVLPDGSRVWINNGSSITYPKAFSAASRRIALEGNAFFEVEKDPSKPFVIETGKLNVKVIGTSFDVYCYENEPSKVTVASGKVEVSHMASNSKIALVKNEQSSFDAQLGKMVKVKMDSGKSAAWRSNVLSFENLELATVIKRIERKFNVKINCQDSTLLSTRIRASYKNEPLDTILNDLAFMINFDYNKNETNNEITLKPLVYEAIE